MKKIWALICILCLAVLPAGALGESTIIVAEAGIGFNEKRTSNLSYMINTAWYAGSEAMREWAKAVGIMSSNETLTESVLTQRILDNHSEFTCKWTAGGDLNLLSANGFTSYPNWVSSPVAMFELKNKTGGSLTLTLSKGEHVLNIKCEYPWDGITYSSGATTGRIFDDTGDTVMIDIDSADQFTLIVEDQFEQNSEEADSYTYQWFDGSDSTLLDGKTQNSITVDKPKSGENDYYYCVVTAYDAQKNPLKSWNHHFHIDIGSSKLPFPLPGGSQAQPYSAPKTGDDALPLVWAVCAVMAFSSILLLRRRMKRSA